ncbi:MAG: acetyl xylan esterase [Chitinophagaceae bacterium]|nr:acetyl xylan esterase [Chitinophagaceae bacterium]MBK8953078.1 acetyl xylan esterase [Chitinophagaceae bacterium]
MNRKFFLFLICIQAVCFASAQPEQNLLFFKPDNPLIQYTGRIDFFKPQMPRFWQPGVYINFAFKGDDCEIILNDEVLWGNNHNYIELVVDGREYRMQTKSKCDTISLKKYLSGKRTHKVVLCKNTEANIGYLELVGIRCKQLVKSTAKPKRKIEFIGNSITCGMGNDDSEIPCKTKNWYDQHNAWLSYGAITARNMKAQFHLSSVSGIGLMKSCCGHKIVMPQVFDNINMFSDTIAWDFKRYQPDVVTVCLGQNDGIQDSAIFCNNYVSFMHQLRQHYPRTTFILLTSPMADDKLRNFLRSSIYEVKARLEKEGERKVFTHVFEKQYIAGCDAHPSKAEHKEIADELTALIKKIMNW